MLHGGDFSGLGAVNPILDQFPILALLLSLSLSRSLKTTTASTPASYFYYTSSGGTLTGVDRNKKNILTGHDSSFLLMIREHVYETNRGN